MISQIYVNLPVKELQASIDFFSSLGFTFNEQFTNENATCMIIGENIYSMLLVEPFFQTFTRKQITNAKQSTEAIIALATDSRERVDELIRLAIKAGGSVPNDIQDHGWIYTHSFEDLDGHVWELLYIDESKLQAGA